MRFISSLLLLVGLLGPLSGVGAARPFDVDDLVNLARVSEPQVAPDGRAVAYVLRAR